MILLNRQSDVLWVPKSGIYQESVDGEQRLKISGPSICMDRDNENDRSYPSKTTIPVVEQYINEWVATGRSMGEYTHPGTPRVDPRNACIGYESLILDRSTMTYIAKARVLKTAPGLALSALLEEGIPMGLSSRILGKEHKDTHEIVVIKVVTPGDVVLDPSNAEAMFTVIMEHKDIIIEEDNSLEGGFDLWEKTLANNGSRAIDALLISALDRIGRAV